MNTYHAFLSWIKIKFSLDNRKDSPMFEEGQLWWCSWGLNVGREQNGKNRYFDRPVLIVRKFGLQNLWAVPITSGVRNSDFFFPIELNGQPSSLILTQLRSLSNLRLLRKIGILEKAKLDQVRNRIKYLL